VIAFDLEWKHSCEALVHALNANLPRDISVREAVQAAENFHPRYDALSRKYQYRLYCQPQRDPLRDRYAARIWPEPDFSDLQAAAAFLPGQKDFASVGTPPRTGGSTIRIVYQAEWRKTGDEFLFTIEANGFLYHMVRRLVFLQMLMGSHQVSLQEFKDGFTEGFQTHPGLAEACGLTLMRVKYRNQQV
jgi:tRNA pseudouridine38-40 synthase